METFKKIVINPHVGGFTLSNKAIYYYLFLKYGKKFYPYMQYDDYYELESSCCYYVCISYDKAFKTTDYVEWLPFHVYEFPARLCKYLPVEYSTPSVTCEWPDYIKQYSDEIYSLYKDRENQYLIKVVERLGNDAHAYGNELKIIEIPSSVCYYIDEHMGMEVIHEQHRTWR